MEDSEHIPTDRLLAVRSEGEILESIIMFAGGDEGGDTDTVTNIEGNKLQTIGSIGRASQDPCNTWHHSPDADTSATVGGPASGEGLGRQLREALTA